MQMSARMEALNEVGAVAWISPCAAFRSKASTSFAPASAYTIMPRGLATATVDRILYHAPLVPTEGLSSGSPDAQNFGVH